MPATYRVKEVFYTLQGEGANAGRAAVFCRFTGCNLWSGHNEDRAKGKGSCSHWCDTDFVGTNGTRGGHYSAQQLVSVIQHCWQGDRVHVKPLVVCTGGEPLLQLDTSLIDTLHDAGFMIAVETNGTMTIPEGIDWVCVSPKAGCDLVVHAGDELKLVYPQPGLQPEQLGHLQFTHWFLQPMDGPSLHQNTQLALDYCRAHPRWRLSVQLHKVLSIP